jgi:hypothetical protein
MPRRFRVLHDDLAGRWSRGEVGEEQENDSKKYDVCLFFGMTPPFEFLGTTLSASRTFYFYQHEVEEVSNA